MGDTTYSVRISDDQKEKLTSLVNESGLNAKEFMQELVQAYEINKTKEALPIVSQDLEELQTLTRRINNIYLGIGERINSLIGSKDEEYRDTIEKKNSLIETLQAKIEALNELNTTFNTDVMNLENDLKDLKDDKASTEKHLAQEINNLKDINDSNKALIDEYKSKIDTMSSIVDEYKGYKENIQVLNNQLQSLKEENRELSIDCDEKAKEIDKSNILIDKLHNKHQQDIESLKEKMEFEKEKAILDLKKIHQEEKQALHDEYNDRIKKLLDEIESRSKNFYTEKEVKEANQKNKK